MKTNYRIAWVHLTSRFRQLAVATLSVTFGISMFIFMNSFISGVNEAQTVITFTSLAHIRIYNDLSAREPAKLIPDTVAGNALSVVNNARNIRYTEGIKDAGPILKALKKQKAITGISPQINTNVFIQNGVTQISAALSGVDVQKENKVFHTADYVVEGDFFDLQKHPNGIILGKGLAQILGVKVGDNISLTSASGGSKNFTIIGLLETGATGVDRSKAIVSLLAARQLNSKNKSYVTDIQIAVSDYNKAQKVAASMAGITSYKIEPWQLGNSQLDSANKLRYIMSFVISVTILIVAGFGIYNIMNMTVNEKIKEIAILKAMGYSGRDIVIIFLTQSIVIGLVGGILGLVLGYIISVCTGYIPFRIATSTTLPINFNTSDYVLGFVFGIVITFLAGYFPASKASKVDPVTIIRG
ncbi:MULTISPECIES: ABC transporter permease [Mesonia]|uniref:Lipoprotein-releasing system transmembrane protein LolE n=1 Tax=Mesonia oceanica TaxID=2687242 RepID=A0AC61YAQ2_9FLAO|nr:MULTISPECIES: FtsX-like permease family protein [Mesonia]MAN27565.1 ABC transporter permease [Mesonia sp.]VVV00968.1 Lipoprotein-releasing system transmembrane protein LolE [Mesonia oceanica]|tara:strand:+ start:6870 stop:8111 length:1242 start_codon:yes stop_codon:yes gene_type:complete